MWKALVGLVLATAVIVTSVVLYPMRHRFFRPSVDQVGGTRVVLKVEGTPEALVAIFRERYDPKQSEGLVIEAHDGRITIDVPHGRRHDELLAQIRSSVRRPGRFRTSVLIHPEDDAPAVIAAKKWLEKPDNCKQLEEAYLKGDPMPPFEGEFKAKGAAEPSARYDWVYLDWYFASVIHGLHTAMAGAATEVVPVFHEIKGGRSRALIVTLARRIASVEGLTNSDVVRPRFENLPGTPFGVRVNYLFEGDGKRRMNDLTTRLVSSSFSKPRRIAHILDDEIVHYVDVYRIQPQFRYSAAVVSVSEAAGMVGMMRAPLPPATQVTLVEEVALDPR